MAFVRCLIKDYLAKCRLTLTGKSRLTVHRLIRRSRSGRTRVYILLDCYEIYSCCFTKRVASLLLLSSIISMMMRLLLDVSICFCPTPEPLLVVQSTSVLLYLHLHCPSISSVVFLGFFPHWYSCNVMLLLAAVRFPFLIYAQTNLVFALLFCQPVSFLDVEFIYLFIYLFADNNNHAVAHNNSE